MKKYTWLAFLPMAVVLAPAVFAEEVEDPAISEEQVETKGIATLTADEMAFAAKLNDQNRRSFSNKCSAEQRTAIMVAFSHGTEANEAVQRMLDLQEMREANFIAEAEDEEE